MLDIPEDALLDVAERGLSPRDMGEILNASESTVRNRIGKLQKKQAVLLEYRKIQNLHLTELQAAILDSITEDDIAAASLSEKVKAYEVLKKAELTDQGKPSEITGTLHYLLQLEEEEAAIVNVEVVTTPTAEKVPIL